MSCFFAAEVGQKIILEQDRWLSIAFPPAHDMCKAYFSMHSTVWHVCIEFAFDEVLLTVAVYLKQITLDFYVHGCVTTASHFDM